MTPIQIETCPLWEPPDNPGTWGFGPRCIATDRYCDIETTENYSSCYRYKQIAKALGVIK